MLGRRLANVMITSAVLAIAAGGCGGLTGVDDTGAVITPVPVEPVAPGAGPSGPQIPHAVEPAGDDQAGLVNQTLANPASIVVRDSLGAPIKNVPVSWTLTGNGRIVVVNDSTDAEGRSAAAWTLGSMPGPQFLTARAAGMSATFTATATLQYESVDAGGQHACGITPSAAVYCWGYNGDGHLGTNDFANRNVPTPIQANLTFRQLSGGRYHTCGITLSGIAYCWGANLDGRLGDGSNDPTMVPVQAATPVAFETIGSGWNHTCGLSKSGLAYCWGFNQHGEVGALIPPPDSVAIEVPRPVTGPIFKLLAVGGLHSCGLDLNSQAWCWGFNGYGQLGDGSTDWTLNNLPDPATQEPVGSTPVEVDMPPVAGFTAIAAGAHHTCALTDTQAWCWGDNRHGQIGPAGGAGSLTPVEVDLPGGVRFVSISAGDFHSCATTPEGKVWCWGDNRYGQLGVADRASSPDPVPVSPELTFRSFSAGETLSCGVTTARAVYCVGDNSYGQIGDGTNIKRLSLTKGSYQP